METETIYTITCTWHSCTTFTTTEVLYVCKSEAIAEELVYFEGKKRGLDVVKRDYGYEAYISCSTGLERAVFRITPHVLMG